MKRQGAIFLIAFLVVAVSGLAYGSTAAADLRILRSAEIDSPGTRIVLGPSSDMLLPTVSQEKYLLEAQQIMAQRLHLLQPRELYDIILEQKQLEVTLPDSENISYIINIITRVGEVEFIDGGDGVPPVGQQVNTGSSTITNQNIYQTLFTGHEIAEVIPPDATSGQLFYQIIPKPIAARRVTDLIDSHAHEYICLVVDKEVVNCSKMYYWSGNALDILPNLSSSADVSLADLAIFLKSGPLPIPLRVVTD